MRKILRRMAKAAMARQGVDHVNKRMRLNWRRVVNAYPEDCLTGKPISKQYVGEKKHQSRYTNHLFVYRAGFVGKSHNGRRRERMAAR